MKKTNEDKKNATSMRVSSLGRISSEGSFLVCDPCYEKDSKSVVKLKVLAGNYICSVTTGKIGNGFGVDRIPEYFRVFRLGIVHEDYCTQDLKYTDSKINLCIDSGQAGFFNPETFKEALKEDYEMIGDSMGLWFDLMITAKSQIERRKKILEEKDLNGCYGRMLKLKSIGTHEKLEEWYKREDESAIREIEESKHILETKKFPSYLPVKKTKDFYEMVCSLTSGENHADVYKEECVVSSSGLGDLGAELMLAKNKSGDVVGAYLEFICVSEML